MQTEAVLLRAVPVGDDARLVTLLTREHGVQTVRVPVRQAARSAKDALEPLHSYQCELGLRERDVARLLTCQMVRSRDGVLGSEARLQAAGAWVRIVRDCLWPGSADADLYDVVVQSLDALLAVDEALLPAEEVQGRAHLLAVLGYAFEAGHCVSCGRDRAPSRAAYVDGARGGIVCRACASGQPLVWAASLAWLVEPAAHAAPSNKELATLHTVLSEALRAHARGSGGGGGGEARAL